jgi:hypothetical protein
MDINIHILWIFQTVSTSMHGQLINQHNSYDLKILQLSQIILKDKYQVNSLVRLPVKQILLCIW